jgi:hypothetical protein
MNSAGCLVEASSNVTVHAQKPDFVFRRNGQRTRIKRKWLRFQDNTRQKSLRKNRDAFSQPVGPTDTVKGRKYTALPLHQFLADYKKNKD